MAGTPEHPITVSLNPNRITVTFAGKTVADTTAALTVREANYAPVHYIPRGDVDGALLRRTAHSTHCPHKGDASYYTIDAGERVSENAIWTYETPKADMAEITGYMAFYPGRVDGITESA